MSKRAAADQASLFQAPAPPQDRTRPRPLAERVRPTTLSAFLGQKHLVGPEKFLAEAIEADSVPSLIFWGPPGSGKTSLARLIAEHTKAEFVSFSAVLGGVGEVREIMREAAERWQREKRRTTLFVDEIHRFNRSQQDAFLPHVEAGTITLVGATTENPSFALTAPLLSRCRVFTLSPLSDEDLRLILERAAFAEDGLAGVPSIDAAVFAAIAKSASGDARYALGLLETAALEAKRRGEALTLTLLDRAH